MSIGSEITEPGRASAIPDGADEKQIVSALVG